ncbi:ABC transporter substrate-binding protein [Hominifimenecus sp. rT4P-3]|uniref:ABC transporter substrate-binding protein n=1 Tax=Hominifimenecus sp. rT4P-3 TaxID=3242979 RepID=UPI003DA426D0
MRKKMGIFLAVLMLGLLAGCGSAAESTGGENGQVYVFNYGDYIDPEVMDLFEEETGIEVVYDTYDTNEEMYPVIESGSVRYDVVCPSDYMIEKMIQNDLLAEIDYANVPNFVNISDTCRNFSASFDPGNRYSVPYNWGTVGILYNTEMIPEGTITSWADLWDAAYLDEILMQDSLRDIYMIAFKRMGLSCNTVEEEKLAEATELLVEQKPLVYKYVNDSARDFLIGESAAIGVIYSGEVLYCQDENENLKYVVPEEGSNVWLDSWVIPKNCRNKENAEAWINFMCRGEIGMMTYEYLTYPTPNTETMKWMSEEELENEALFPPEDVLERCEVYHYLGEEMDELYNSYWKDFKSR